MNSKFLIPLSIIIISLIVAGAIIYTGGIPQEKITDRGVPEIGSEEATEETVLEGVSVQIEGWPVLGDPNAPVVIVEYSDFACPFCASFWQETLPLIKENYIDTGKVYFVYKDFVVVGGDRAAEAAHCAAEQDKFWQYHDLLFERQAQDRGQWSNSQVHKGYVQELGLDEDALLTCFEERRYRQKVDQSTKEAIASGGRGTPFFLVNGQPVAGAQPYSVFENIIDGLLQEK